MTLRVAQAGGSSRRRLLQTAAGALLGGLLPACQRLARAPQPEGEISEKGRALIARSWEGLDPAQVLDCHVHIAGLGQNGSGCRVHPNALMRTRHPIEWSRFEIYRMASGIEDLEQADQQFIERLLQLVRSPWQRGRFNLLAFDQVYTEQGTASPDHSQFYTPNDYVLELASLHSDVFTATGSVHPYREDALDELDRIAEQGAIAIKWLPSAQQIDPAHPRCTAFYDRLASLKLPLLTHAGHEAAVDVADLQALGNPLLLRHPLGRGVTVLVAHCASLGSDRDLDSPSQPWVESVDLFLRLLAEPDWQGRLFGDVSALTQLNRCGRPLKEALSNPLLAGRMVNGSDYPLSAINALVLLDQLSFKGYLDDEDLDPLAEIYAHDPVMFDLALKRALRVEHEGEIRAFAPGVFMPSTAVFPRLLPRA